MRLALDDVARGLQQVARQVHAAGKVVRAACGDIADGRVASGRIDTGDNLIECAVAACADHAVEFAAAGCCDLRCVAAGSCSIDRDVVAAAVENADDLRQRAVRALFPEQGSE